MPPPAAPSPPGRLAHAGVLALTVAVFGGVVGFVTLQLRAGQRDQIVRREAEMLATVASMHLDNRAAELVDVRLEDVPAALLVAVLKTSKLAGVSGVRIFDVDRRLSYAWPFRWTEDAPPAEAWRAVAAGSSVGRLYSGVSSEDVVVGLPAGERGESTFEAWVPLRRADSGSVLGAAHFVRSGNELSADLRDHDRRLWTQAALAWLGGSAVIALVFGWALRRLESANRELRARSEDLQRANRELVLAAKTSALGAVTAHLMHELKNPLAGLETIVAGQSEAALRGQGGGGELAAASELTRRLRTMVNDVVGVLRDEQSGADFELTPPEVAELTRAKVEAEARSRGLTLAIDATGNTALSGRRANLATLILRNLLQNALEASPAGGVVRLLARDRADRAVEFTVSDAGPGLPAAIRSRLFQPCASTKLGGSGLGLALSHQLAQQAGGQLELVASGASGTTFRLVLPPEA